MCGGARTGRRRRDSARAAGRPCAITACQHAADIHVRLHDHLLPGGITDPDQTGRSRATAADYAEPATAPTATERQARQVLAALGNRMEEVGLRLHPGKTRIAYCQDKWRRGSHEHRSFDFLGFTFRQRTANAGNGQMFMRFLPAISKEAQKKISREIHSWRIHRQIGLTFAGLARRVNPVVAGWMRY
jgi:hypothetical protein